MTPPDWKATGAAGLVVGLAISGFVLVSPTGSRPVVQTIELRQITSAATADPMPLVVDDITSPTPTGAVPASPIRSADPAPPGTPTVVAPQVVSEQPAATPRHAPDETDEPEETESPDETDEPEETESPDETDEPEETESPDETDEPEETESPDETDEPEG